MPLGHSTGRITKSLTPIARRILFERDLVSQIDEELPYICQIDFAHILMLRKNGIVDDEPAKRLLKTIRNLERTEFSEMRSRSPIRGLFLMYESYLIDKEGPTVGGLLQTGRSRNDLGAAALRMRLRKPYLRLMSSLFRLQAALLRRARMFAETVMPAYTHSQAAEPITYGHYLTAVATALNRDVNGLFHAVEELDTSPLGAGAIAGTSVPIDTAMTARLLGFVRLSSNSVDAVASRDFVLRLLAAMAICGATLSRIAADLLQWLTAEFRFLSLPDDLVGSSSAMPQKRNPFLLEHVQGRTASALGAFSGALAASRNVPFTNSISVGTESVRPVWNALQDITDAATLLRLTVTHAEPCPEQMLRRAKEGFTNATAIATNLVMKNGMDFRSAHHAVGAAITEAITKGLVSLRELSENDLLRSSLVDTDPPSCVAHNRFGGGPAPEVLNRTFEGLREEWLNCYRKVRQQAQRWATAREMLDKAVAKVCDE